MRYPIALAVSLLILSAVTACSSPPTKTVRTTTTTTTTDESGNATAAAHSELRTNVPVSSAPIMTPAPPALPYGTTQTVKQSQSTDLNGTTTTSKRVTHY